MNKSVEPIPVAGRAGSVDLVAGVLTVASAPGAGKQITLQGGDAKTGHPAAPL